MTPSSVTFCRCDGLVYTHPFVTPITDVPSPLPLSDSVSTTELPLSVPPLDIDFSNLVPSLVTPDSVRVLLDDLNTAPLSLVPAFDQPEGTVTEQFTQLLGRYRRGTIRQRRDRSGEHEQLRTAYHLGQLYRRHKQVVAPILQRELAPRNRFRILRAIQRAYAVVTRIGLTRLYGTSALSISRLDHLTTTEYQTHLLPGILVDSEDLAFLGGEDVTLASRNTSSDCHTDGHEHFLGAADLSAPPSPHGNA